jgi:hypothetical protein
MCIFTDMMESHARYPPYLGSTRIWRDAHESPRFGLAQIPLHHTLNLTSLILSLPIRIIKHYTAECILPSSSAMEDPMTTVPTIDLPILHCARCEHTWIPRRPQPPKVCPACKQDWTTPAKPVGRPKKRRNSVATPS